MPRTEAPGAECVLEEAGLAKVAIMAALDAVLDPELDEPVTTMGFIEDVTCEGREVEVVFRLPTFWCSANFAYLMASDMRVAVETLDFVDKATIRLVDHFAARKINRGVAAGEGFAAAFAGEADTNLDEIRRVFRERAFLGRQETLLRALVTRRGLDAALATTVGDLGELQDPDDPELRAAALRYLGMRRHEGRSAEPGEPAFITVAGDPVTSSSYEGHRRALRTIRGAAQANAEMCRIYLEARIAHPAPGCGPENRKDREDDE